MLQAEPKVTGTFHEQDPKVGLQKEELRLETGLRGERHSLLFRGPRFDSLHPHSSLQPSVTLVPGALAPFSGLCWHCKHKMLANNQTHKVKMRGFALEAEELGRGPSFTSRK